MSSTVKKVAVIVGIALTAIAAILLAGVAPGSFSGSASGAVPLQDKFPAQVTGTQSEPQARVTRTYYVRSTKRDGDPLCVKKRQVTGQDGRCASEWVLRTTNKFRAPGTSTRTASQRGVNEVWCKEWKATARGLFYINWKEEMRGTYCWYEGPAAPRVWDNRYGCGYSNGFGYTVDNAGCWDDKNYGDTTYGWWISDWDKYKVGVVTRGIPISFTYQMHVNLHPTGNITFYNN